MPVGTSASQSADEVVVTVFDDDGGPGDTHTIDLTISWDPALLCCTDSNPPAAGIAEHLDNKCGVLLWKKFSFEATSIPAFGISFKCLTAEGGWVAFSWQDCAMKSCNGPHYAHPSESVMFKCSEADSKKP